MLDNIIMIFFAGVFLIGLGLTFIDLLKRKKSNFNPEISIIIPTYKNEKIISKTISSLFSIYPKEKIELIVINDCSPDNTKEVLKKLQKKYDFLLINNEKNLGKVKSVNKAIKKTKKDFIMILDSDSILNKKSLREVLDRISQKNVAAVSCRYRVLDNGVIPKMVNLEYGMLGMVNGGYNLFTAISIWGGCSLYKRKPLFDIGLFKENMIVEDMDSALNLIEKGWKVQQVFSPMDTEVPKDLKGWYKQKIRWASGGMQCFLKHPKVFLIHPLTIFYYFAYGLFGVIMIYYLLQGSKIGVVNFFQMTLFFALLSSIYLFINLKSIKEIWKIIYVPFFSIIYYPIFIAVSGLGFAIGVKKYFQLKKGGRGW